MSWQRVGFIQSPLTRENKVELESSPLPGFAFRAIGMVVGAEESLPAELKK